MNGAMVRIIAKGVPYYTDSANHVYAYGIDQPGQPRLHIGEYNPATEHVTLGSSWEELFNERLAAYRTSCAGPRLRNDPAGTPKRSKRSAVPKKKASAPSVT